MTISDIVNKVYTYTKTNSASFQAPKMLISINNAYNRAAALILQSDGRWEWDDTNQTDLPTSTTSLVASQQDYTLATSHLRIQRVEIKKNGGTQFTLLEPVDVVDRDRVIDSSSTGTPMYYDVRGISIVLYPIPDYSQAASLKVYFQRGPAEFTSGEVSTGTKSPGFSSLYHELIPLYVAEDYWLTNDQKYINGFQNKIAVMEDKIVKDYSKRDKADTARITTDYITHR